MLTSLLYGCFAPLFDMPSLQLRMIWLTDPLDLILVLPNGTALAGDRGPGKVCRQSPEAP